MIVILIAVGIFFMGFVLGYFTHRQSFQDKSSGTIHVTHDREKLLYTLELDDYPESIQFKKKVLFKVDAPDKSLDRE